MTEDTENMKYEMFARESHMLGGVVDEPDVITLNAYRVLMKSTTLSMAGLTHLATAVVPGSVPIADKTPELRELLNTVNLGLEATLMEVEQYLVKDRAAVEAQKRAWLAYTLHRAFHELQPYRTQPNKNPNGIVGRAAWLWTMGGIEGSFLVTWYQQSLRFGGVVTAPAKEK